MNDPEGVTPAEPTVPDQQPTPEIPPIVPREILYAEFGFTQPIIEVVANDPKAVVDVNKINTSLPRDHYAEANPNETLADTREWLEETTSPFEANNFTEESIVIAAKPSREEGITKYIYYYPSEEKLPKALKQKYQGKAVLDVSYVTAEPDKNQDAEETAKIYEQSSMLLIERSLNRSSENLTGRLSPDEVTNADQKLVFLAAVQSKGEEKSHTALQLAGFKKSHTYLYKEDSKEYTVYSLSPANLVSKFDRRQSASTPPSTT